MEYKYKMEGLSYSLVEGSNNKYFLQLNGRRYYVGILVIEILKLLQTERSSLQIAMELNKKYGTEYFNESSVRTLIEKDLAEQGILLNESRPYVNRQTSYQYIYGRINFLKVQNFPKFLSVLGILYVPFVIWLIFITAIGSTMFVILKERETIMQLSSYSIPVILFMFAFSIINTLWHEIGHAVAAFRYGIIPKDIGFGFYIIYPTFFTDVSDIWKLNKKQRNMVNLGGIYFQMIVTIVLVGLYYLFPNIFWIVPMLIVLNTATAIISLNPFFRYDGYWCYSDYFDLPNLRSQSNEISKFLFQNIIGKKVVTWKSLSSKPFPLVVYALGSILFFTGIIISVSWSSILQVQTVIGLLAHPDSSVSWLHQIMKIVKNIFPIIMVVVFLCWTINRRRREVQLTDDKK